MSAVALSQAVKPSILASITPRLAASLSIFRPSWSMPCEPSTSYAGLQTAREQSSWMDVMPSLSSLLELLPPLVLTTPKKKTSRARRGKGMENKWLRNRTSESSYQPRDRCMAARSFRQATARGRLIACGLDGLRMVWASPFHNRLTISDDQILKYARHADTHI
jgi:hypothetical protein